MLDRDLVNYFSLAWLVNKHYSQITFLVAYIRFSMVHALFECFLTLAWHDINDEELVQIMRTHYLYQVILSLRNNIVSRPVKVMSPLRYEPRYKLEVHPIYTNSTFETNYWVIIWSQRRQGTIEIAIMRILHMEILITSHSFPLNVREISRNNWE